ncbi:MAG: NAD(P)H-binding protein [Prolixibacteraceae bacterium]
MKNVIILGSSGQIARQVTDILVKFNDINLTLFVRKRSRLSHKDLSNYHIIEGDILDYETLKKAISGQDIVYINLAGNLGPMAQNIVKAMNETGVKRIIAISSIGIYDSPLRSVLVPYRRFRISLGFNFGIGIKTKR